MLLPRMCACFNAQCSFSIRFLLCAQEVTIGLILISVVTYFCFAFSGFIVQPIPKYFVWLHKISYYSLAYTILVKNEFTGLNIQ
jgi:hypothetical protein